jgi:hypothetical protein
MQDGVTLRNLVYPYQITQAALVVGRMPLTIVTEFSVYHGRVGDREREKTQEDDIDFSSLMTYSLGAKWPQSWSSLQADAGARRFVQSTVLVHYL